MVRAGFWFGDVYRKNYESISAVGQGIEMHLSI